MGNCAQWITVVEAFASRHTRRNVGNLAARRFERGVAQEGCGRSDLRTSVLDELEHGRRPEFSSANLRNCVLSYLYRSAVKVLAPDCRDDETRRLAS